jgi:hypothetical protein
MPCCPLSSPKSKDLKWAYEFESSITSSVPLPVFRFELQDAVTRAQNRAAVTGELLPSPASSARAPLSAEVSRFIREILTDGSYEQEIIRIGKEDPDLASM